MTSELLFPPGGLLGLLSAPQGLVANCLLLQDHWDVYCCTTGGIAVSSSRIGGLLTSPVRLVGILCPPLGLVGDTLSPIPLSVLLPPLLGLVQTVLLR